MFLLAMAIIAASKGSQLRIEKHGSDGSRQTSDPMLRRAYSDSGFEMSHWMNTETESYGH